MKNRRSAGKITRAANKEFTEYDISNDLLLSFACSPMFQLSFATEERAAEILLKEFRHRNCRVLRWKDESGSSVHQAVLQFGLRRFVHIRNGPSHCVHVYADTARRAEALEKRVAPRVDAREEYDALEKLRDPSHTCALTEDELARLGGSAAGVQMQFQK